MSIINNKEFREEIHCYIDKRYNKFLEYQKIALEILEDFHRVCKQNNITYYLAYGSLLGLVRDGNEIPWDYDVDVQVPYKEKEKLINALHKDLKEEYYIYCPETDKRCRHYFIRLSKKGFNSSALHVDVFYIIGAPSHKLEFNIFSRTVRFISNIRYHKLINIKEESMGNKKVYLYNVFFKMIYAVIPIKLLDLCYERLCNKFCIMESKYYITADSYASTKYRVETIKNRKLISNFQGVEFYIPLNYDEILKIVYGNYKEYPTTKSRFNEFMRYLDRLEYFNNLHD